MAADIEFNVRNGMTVGANKHMVLDVNGALSAANIVIHTGGKLLSAGEHDVIDVINTSITSSTEMLYIGGLSADWESTHTTVGSYSGDWESTHTSVMTTSTNWDDVYTDVGHNRGNWNSVYTTVGGYSGDWESVHASVLTTSSNWDDVYTDVGHNRGNWNSVYTAVGGYSADWDSTRTSVFTTSGEWDTAYGWGNHATQNYATTSDVSTAISNLVDSAPATLDTLNELAAALGDDANFSTTITNSIGTKWTQDDDKITNWDSVYLTTQGYSALWDSTRTSVFANSGDWETAHGWGDHANAGYLTSFTETDPVFVAHAAHGITTQKITDWDNTYTDVSTTSGEWDTAYGWGDHGSAGYLTSFTETDPVFSAHAAANVTTQKITNWDSTHTTVNSNSADWSTPGTTTLAGATDANITNPAKGEILVYTNGGTQKWTNKTDRAGLEEMYNYANTNFYNELSYSSTDSTVLTGVDVYVSSAKATHLFSREFVYSTTGTLTAITTTDEQNNNTLTKNMYYHTTTGALTSVTRSYS